MESDTVTTGVMYSETFTVRNRFCFTRCTANTSRVQIYSYINYLSKPNFIAKSNIYSIHASYKASNRFE